MMRFNSGSKAGAIAYRSLKDMVTTYQLRPYEQLQAQALADRFGVSATPVREAMLRLFGEGLVACNPHRGFYVKPIDLQEVRQLLDLRCQLLTNALQQSGDFSAATAFDHALDAADGIEGRTDLEGQVRAVDLLIAARSGNRPLFDLIANISDKIRFVVYTELSTREGRMMNLSEAGAITAHLKENELPDIARIVKAQSQRRAATLTDLAAQVAAGIVRRDADGPDEPLFVPLCPRTIAAMAALP
jgi:DNA-binding GntR family transcriptional regulator